MATLSTGDNLKRLTGDERLGQNRESEYLGAEDIDPGTEPILTIEGIWNGLVTLQRGKENKDVMTFVEKNTNGIHNVRPLIINATNRKTLKKIYGSVTATALAGKKIQLYIDPKVRDPQDGSMRDGIRIRPFAPKVTKKAIICEGCNKAVTPASNMSAEQVAEYTKGRFGKTLCAECATKIVEKEQTEKSEGN
jgi:hypothetical protein